jgi:hypothetical protein
MESLSISDTRGTKRNSSSHEVQQWMDIRTAGSLSEPQVIMIKDIILYHLHSSPNLGAVIEAAYSQLRTLNNESMETDNVTA